MSFVLPKVMAVTRAQVNAAIAKHLSLERASERVLIVISGDAGPVEASLRTAKLEPSVRIGVEELK